jgi:DNA replication licensing factor MCM5
VSIDDLQAFDPRLADGVVNRPAEYLPLFEAAAREAVALSDPSATAKELEPVHVTLRSGADPIPMRAVGSGHISQVIKLPGIAIACSRVRAKATEVTAACRQCRATLRIMVSEGLSGITLPRQCEAQAGAAAGAAAADRVRCPLDPFVIVGDKSYFVDQQTVKLQERPESVPTGEMPRSVLAVLDRTLVGRIIPGTRVNLVGVWSIFQSMRARGAASGGNAAAGAIRQPYLRIVGVEIDTEGGSRSRESFTPEEEAEFLEVAKRPEWYDQFSSSIAPAIYGHADIKKAISCLLMGGTRKRLPDGMRLRGDINVLLLGDPGTAKSQLLKFTEKVSPIAVYTSGKGSSAAGLTASVVRDPSSREFYLEGGAMVLADGGVVCIDEFDKMREEDRVAIHEAMEQQTISIAKAGITTILNSRTAVLAAANPVFGVYDDMRSPTDNINFQSTILSRFDLIFIVRDTKDPARDDAIAQHVIGLHVRGETNAQEAEGTLSIAAMKKFVSFARARCSPRLSADAAKVLQAHYVTIRKEMRDKTAGAGDEGSSPIPITVRQLEAIIRISEGLAKLSLEPTVTVEHVNEAMHLFKVATVDAANAGVIGAIEGYVTDDVRKSVETAKDAIRRKLPPRSSTNTDRFVRELVAVNRLSDFAVRQAVQLLVSTGELRFKNERRTVYRVK